MQLELEQNGWRNLSDRRIKQEKEREKEAKRTTTRTTTTNIQRDDTYKRIGQESSPLFGT